MLSTNSLLSSSSNENKCHHTSSSSVTKRPREETTQTVHQLSTPVPPTTRCEVCKGGGAFVEMVPCGHRFHARCVFGWPARQCCGCMQQVHRVRLLANDKTLLQIKPKTTQQQQLQQLQQEQQSSLGVVSRKGKWSADEFRYANALMRLFQQGTLPLADGLHLRAFLAQLLQCDPLRVTKKYAGQAIGKQNFVYRGPNASLSASTVCAGGASGGPICFTSHVKVQKRLTSLRNHFYWNLQYRARGHSGKSCDEAIARLKQLETNYWIQQFHRFAMRIGQQVEFANSWSSSSVTPSTPLASASSTPSTPAPITPPAKKKARALATQPVQEPVHDKIKQLVARVPPTQCDTTEKAKDSDELQSGTFSPLSLDEWNEEASRLESLPSDLLGNFADLEFFSVLGDDEPVENDSAGMSAASSSIASSSFRNKQQQCALDALWLDEEPQQFSSSQWNWSSLSWLEF